MPEHTTETQVIGEIDRRRIADAEAAAARSRDEARRAAPAPAPRPSRAKQTRGQDPTTDEPEEAQS